MVTNSADTFWASGPSLPSTSEISNSAGGQTSGQWVKPKNTRYGCPRKSLSVTVRPSWSTRLNGPPIAAAPALGNGSRPLTSSTTSTIEATPARKPASMSTIWAVRAFIGSASEARLQPGDAHLVEHRAAVIDPQRARRGDQHAGHRRENQRN